MITSRFSYSLTLLFLLSSFWASGQRSIPSERPQLIVQIVVSQMRYDYLQRYSDKFSEGGFKQLMTEGAFCRNARFNYLLTQSMPGLATIATGTYPSIHGIVSDRWYAPLSGSEVHAIADDRVRTVGGSYMNGKYSPRNIITSTIGDEIRMINPKSKVIGISLEPSSAIITSGHNANGAFWLDTERGIWISNSHYMNALPSWVDTLNAKGFGEIYLSRDWNLMNPLTSYIEADTTAIKEPQALKRITDKLARLVKGVVLQFKRPIRDYSPLLETPFGITYTKDLAIAAIVGEELGKNSNTDFLSVTFSPTRKIGNKYGPHSIEMEDTFLRLDRELEHFIAFLNSEVGRHNYLLILTSDQGVSASPEHLEKSKIPGGYFEPQKAIMLLSSYLNVVYGTGTWILGYQEKQIYLNRRLIEDSNLSLRDFQDRVAMFMLQLTGVANAATAYNLQSSNFTSGIFEKFQNSYNQRRSGDVIINLEPGWVEKNGSITSANSPYSYDSHVPLIWYGWKMKRRQVLEPVNMSDIAPTISTLIGINWPSGATGKPIKEIIE